MLKFSSQNKKLAYSLILGFFIFTQIFGSIFLYAKPAQAQIPTSNAILDSASVQETIDRVAEQRMEELQGTWWMGLVSAVMNAVGYFANKIAYDAAVAIASLGSGQTPAFFTQDWGSYLTDTALNSAGEFIGSFSESYGEDLHVGNLCMPPDPQIRLNIGLSLSNSVTPPPQPRCEWSNIVQQWDTFITEASTPDILDRVSLQFRPNSGNDLGAFIGASAKLNDDMDKSAKTATKNREEGQGFKSVGDLITKNIKTPSTVVKDSITKQIDPAKASEQDIEKAGSQASSPGALVGQNALSMLGSIASTFVNTLASKLMDRVMGGLYSLKDIGRLFPKGRGGLDNPEFAGLGGRAVAEATFADFLAPRIQEAERYDPLVEMMTCPSSNNKAPENCVLDSQFAQAITRATMGDPLTVSEAIEEGLLRGDWPLIPEGDSRHNDQHCFQRGYCYSNLVKLRKYRILPIGWEMAANLAVNERTGATLKMVMDSYNDCNDEGVADVDHPWCHLIDPNWILKAPAHQCRARVYGAISSEGARLETCVDSPSCLSEDDDGSCVGGWGYCTREKNIWRLPGDACDEQFDSCRALRTREGEIVSYLMNTVDYGPPCTADDVGCRWYSTFQSRPEEGEYSWQDRTSGDGEKIDRMYFNKNVTQCDEEGCSEFYKTSRGASLNLVINSGFEEIIDVDDEEQLKNWEGDISNLSEESYEGRRAIEMGGSISQDIDIGKPLNGRNILLSLYAKNVEGENCGGSMLLVGGPGRTGRDIETDADWTGASWERFVVEGFFVDNFSTAVTVTIEGDGCLFDAVQLEESASLTPYHSGWSGLEDAMYLKKAPEYYSCYNYNRDGTVDTTDDAEQCSNFIGACQENEVGCEEYTPRNGDPRVPGIANYPNDYCPMECVGYETFKQLETNFEEEKYPLYFIPDTALSCSASQEGCDEFTSLETEMVENYTYLRQCQKPIAGDDAETYYTWEGSDTTGYQLKTWNLKSSGVEAGESLSDPDGGIAPCTALAPGALADGTRSCEVGPRAEEGFCTRRETIVGSSSYNPDCRGFYDEEGNVHYRLYTKTIVVTDDCHEYKKTYSTESDCETSDGLWNAINNDCKYDVYPIESRRCSAVDCRSYRGNAGGNVRRIFQSDFETGADDWSGAGVLQSSEAVDSGGHSLKVNEGSTATRSVAEEVRRDGIYTITFWAKSERGDASVNFQFTDGDAGEGRLDREIEEELTLSWQKYTIGPIQATWEPTPDNPATEDVIEGDNFIASAIGGNIYLDNILFKEVIDRIYLIKDSWTTPITCDQTAFGGYLPQAMLGCQEYRDRNNRQHYLKSFTSLCREEAIGCERLVDTKNNSTPYGEVYNAVCRLGDACPDGEGCSCFVGGTNVCRALRGQSSCRYNSLGVIVNPENRAEDTIEIAADSYAYLVVDNSKVCNPSNVGCEAFGAPRLDSSGSVICTLDALCDAEEGCACRRDGATMCTVPEGEETCTGEFDSVNFLNNTRFYEGQSKIICEASYDSCEEYLGSDNSTFYFRKPGERTCEWKDNVTYGGEKRSGWWREDHEGEMVPCYEEYAAGGVFGIWRNADEDYDKWVGDCPVEQNMCIKFVDPTSTSGENPDGEPYFYIKNEKLMGKAGECNGQVSLQQGCILFEDTSNLNKFYNAQLSYSRSEEGGEGISPGEKVGPIDCNSEDCGGRCTRPPLCVVGVDCTPLCSDDRDCVFGSRCEMFNNDTNIIFKVRKDRVCGEWLSCKTSTSTWDSYSNKKREICDGLGLCNKVAEGSDAVDCANWIDDDPENKDAQILDLLKYTSRSTGWDSFDYSGYSVPNQIQTHKLSQVNLADPEEIGASSFKSMWKLAFTEEEACFGEVIGESFGRYVDDSRDCDEDDDPAGCFNISRDCNPGEAKGTCGLRDGTECRVTEDGRTVREGKCWNRKCVYDPEGRPIDGFPSIAEFKPLEENSIFEPLCRAYPEKNSPFPRSVAYASDGITRERKQGFSNARICEVNKVCVGGAEHGEFCFDNDDCEEEDVAGERGFCNEEIVKGCECSYKKVSYRGTTKYYTRKNDNIPGAICVGGQNSVDGKACSLDECPGPTDDPTTEGVDESELGDCECGPSGKAGSGNCVAFNKVETVLGLEGYCLEKDKTTYINGSPNENACLSWLPIDHLSGSADIYNQYTKAGYAPGEKGQMCLQTELYVRPRPVWGCVNSKSSSWSDGTCDYDMYRDTDSRDCQWVGEAHGCNSGSATPECGLCPANWRYIEAGCAPNHDRDYCGNLYTWFNGCIYYCIPPGPLVNSKNTPELEDDIPLGDDSDPIIAGERILNPSVCFPDRKEYIGNRDSGSGGYFVREDDAGRFTIDGAGRESRTSPALYCEADYFITIAEWDAILEGLEYPYHGFGRDVTEEIEKPAQRYYPGCKEIIDVAESTDSTKAWTDRIYGRSTSCVEVDGLGGEKRCISGSLRAGERCFIDQDCNSVKSAILDSPDFVSLNYDYYTNMSPFGYAAGDSGRLDEAKPLSIPSCLSGPRIEMPDTNLECDDGAAIGLIGRDAVARPYMSFNFAKGDTCENDEDCNEPGITCDRECIKRCERDADCAGGEFCTGGEGETVQELEEFMTILETDICLADLHTEVRYCVSEARGEPVYLDGLSPRQADDGTYCHSACEMGDGVDRGFALGTCSNNRGRLCRDREDCYEALCGTDVGGEREDEIRRWVRMVGLEWEEWTRESESSVCFGAERGVIVPSGTNHEGERGGLVGRQDRGKTRIAQIFARSFGLYEWESRVENDDGRLVITREDDFLGGYSYEGEAVADSGDISENRLSIWNITERGGIEIDEVTGQTPNQPQVVPLQLPCVNDKCAPLRQDGAYVDGITVNDKNSGTLISRSGELRANIKFFAWADKNQMPLKRVCVDFGNDDTSSDCNNPINFYKNHWGYKDGGSGGSACDSSDFGRTSQACTEDYFSYNTIYTCSAESAEELDRCDDDINTNCWETNCSDPSVGGRGCCVFRPKVQVLDNWGWCNGFCPGPPGFGDNINGCYDKSWDGRTDECSVVPLAARNDNPWTPQNVKVIVVPR